MPIAASTASARGPGHGAGSEAGDSGRDGPERDGSEIGGCERDDSETGGPELTGSDADGRGRAGSGSSLLTRPSMSSPPASASRDSSFSAWTSTHPSLRSIDSVPGVSVIESA